MPGNSVSYAGLILSLLLALNAPVPGQSESAADLDRAIDLYDAGQPHEAYGLIREVLRSSTDDDPKAWLYLGRTARLLERYAEAERALEKAISADRDYAAAHAELGLLHVDQTRWSAAISALEQAVELDPASADYHTQLGNVYRKNGLWEKAIESYDRAIVLDPTEAIAAALKTCVEAGRELRELGYLTAQTLTRLSNLEYDVSAGGQRDRQRGFAPPQPSSSVPMHIEFGTGRYAYVDLSANGREQLRQLGILLKTPGWAGRKIVVEGHTCSCGSAGGNKRLAEKRARAVRRFLIDQGDTSEEMVIVVSHGEEKTVSGSPIEDLPADRCELDPLHSMDRRVVVRTRVPDESAASAVAIDPALHTQVSFWYRTSGSSGVFLPLRDGGGLKSGDEFRLFLMSEQPAYAYIFHHGSAGDWTCLFPNRQFSLEAPATNPLEPGRKYWLPRFGAGIPLDQHPGTEETFVRISARPDPELERWVAHGVPVPVAAGDALIDSQARGLGGIVTVTPEIGSVDWHTRLKFRHDP